MDSDSAPVCVCLDDIFSLFYAAWQKDESRQGKKRSPLLSQMESVLADLFAYFFADEAWTHYFKTT